MRPFHYPPGVIGQLRAAWDTRGWHEPEPDPLPENEILQEVLEVAYHASFTAEERRSTKLSMVFCKPNETEGALVFDRPRDFSVHEIMRLAPAGDIDTDPIGIQIDSTNGIQIWGFASERSWRHPTFSIPSPGTVELRRYSRSVFVLAAGRVSPVEVVDLYLITTLFEAAARSLVNEFVQRRSPIGNAYNPDLFYGEVMIDLLREAARHGHGATIFIIPNESATSCHLGNLFHIKYACASATPLWPTLQKAARGLVYELSDPLEGQRDSRTPMDATTEQEKDHELDEWPRRVARLSRVDGGVLITDRYQLLGFGVEVIVPAEDLRTIRIAGGSIEDIEQYGTRHRAAFRLCAKWPEAIAFVCSQDGGIKCVHNCDGVVTLWK